MTTHAGDVRLAREPSAVPLTRVATRVVRRPLRFSGLAAVLALLGVFFAWPIIDIILRSLSPQGVVSYTHPSFSLVNYKSIWSDHTLREVAKRTLTLAFWSTLATTALAYPTAYLLSRLKRRTASILLALIIVPFLVSILVRLFAFTQILSTNGVANDAAGWFHLGPFDLLYNTPATMIGMVNYLLPYMILILYASMSAVDPQLTVAARSLGASSWDTFRRIFFPLTKSALVSGVLLIFVLALGFFLTPAVLGGPQNTTIAVYIQQQINLYEWGTASAMGVVLLAATMVGFFIAIRVSGISTLVGGWASGSKGSSQVEPLRRTPLTVFLYVCLAIVLLVLLIPLAIVIPVSFDRTQFITFPPHGLSLQWYRQVLHDPMWTDAMWKSVKTAFGTGILATALGLAMARSILIMRSKNLKALMQGLVYAPLVAPVILLSIGIFDIEARIHLIGSVWGLIFAHTVLALPFTFAIAFNALAGLDPSLEQAAWTMGASKTRALYSVVIRQVLPSLVGAVFLSFIISWDEVVIAMFQTGASPTLPVTIFSFLTAGVQPSVAAVATMLIGLVIVGLIGSQLVQRRVNRRRAVSE